MDIGNEILGEIQQLYNLPLIGYTVDNIKLMYKQVSGSFHFIVCACKMLHSIVRLPIVSNSRAPRK